MGTFQASLKKNLLKHRHRWIAYSFRMWAVPEDLVLVEKLQADNHSMQLFSSFRRNTSYDLHMWRQYCHFVGIHAIIGYHWYSWTILASQCHHRDGARFVLKSFFMYRYLWDVSGQLSVSQGLGIRKFVKTMDVSRYMLVNPWNASALSGLAGCTCSHFKLAVSS